MDYIEAVRQIDQALLNLPDTYPYKDKANEAFGALILGHLGFSSGGTILHITEGDTTIVEFKNPTLIV